MKNIRLDRLNLRIKRLKTKTPSESDHFDYELSLMNPSFNPLVREVLNRINRSGSKDEIHCAVILANLLKGFFKGGYFTAFSKRREKLNGQYSGFDLIQHRIKDLIDLLVSYGLVEYHKGYKDQKKKASIPSKLRATEWLINLAHECLSDEVRLVRPKNREPLRLRGPAPEGFKKGKLIGYTEAESLRRMRARLNRYNRRLSETAITLDESKADPSIFKTVDYTDTFTYRVFSQGRWDRGGRFYGGWWVNLPNDEENEQRPHILINGESTVEVDFRNQALVLLYALKGVHFGDQRKDGYEIELPDGKSIPRDVAKGLFTIAINCPSPDLTIGAFIADYKAKRNDAKENDRPFKELPKRILHSLDSILDQFLSTHKPVREYFWQEEPIGLWLQFLDSLIADEVLRLMTGKKIPTLCLHDSFVCASQYEEVLRSAIAKAYRRVLREKLRFDESGNLRLKVIRQDESETIDQPI